MGVRGEVEKIDKLKPPDEVVVINEDQFAG